jgi:uncharacterized protein (TIGR02679 family)
VTGSTTDAMTDTTTGWTGAVTGSPATSAVGGGVQLPERARGFLEHPGLGPLWDRVRDRLEHNGLAASGTITVELREDGAERLERLLSRRLTAGRVRVDLAGLDAALRSSAAAAGLVAVTAALGGPLVDRAAARAQRDATWSAVWAELDGGLAAAGLAAAPWVPAFTDGVRRSGVLTRAGADAARTAVGRAAATLAELAEGTPLTGEAELPEPRWELAELAGRTTGDAHGLDDGRLAAALLLRAVAAAAGEPAPATPAERRALWERVGVTADQVSGTVLVWGLRPPGAGPWAAAMRQRAELGLPTHLTLYELRAVAGEAPAVAGQRVFACENPQVLQAAARVGATAPLICFSGNPASAGLLLLARLVDAGADVPYHGDFDWAGIRIAARLARRGAGLWRMGADDYEAAVADLPADGRLTLTGSTTLTPWDERLAIAMSREQIAVHEEMLLTPLLDDLR